MAATNFTPIQLYHSTTASAVPVNTNLVNGELAINITDGKLFYKDNTGTVQVIATKGASTIGGSDTQVQYNNSGVLAGSANLTFDGTTTTAAALTVTGLVTFSATTANLVLGTSQTSGAVTVGGTAQTGTQTFGQTTKTHTLNLGSGATESGSGKTVNLGTGGVAGSTTTINIGSTNGTTINVNGTVNATTLDLTNLEVTNIKAKDGTASITLADSTGVATFSKATVIETTDNTNAALRITQLGTGNALLVEDSANPDSTPFVVTAGGNTGIGTSSLTAKLTILSDASQSFASFDAPTAGYSYAAFRSNGTAYGYAGQSSAIVTSGSNTDFALQAVNNFVVATGGATAKMTLDSSGNLGLGVNPTAAYGGLQVVGPTSASLYTQQGIDVVRAGVRASGRTGIVFDSSDATYTNRMWYIANEGASGSLDIGRSGLSVLTMNNSGNLGIGVPPSTWGSSDKAIDIGGGNQSTVSANLAGAFATNAYFDGTNWKYKNSTGSPGLYSQSFLGVHRWFNAAPGTQNQTITFGDAKMTLDLSGNLLVGPTSANAKLDVSSAGTVGRFVCTGADLTLSLIQSSATPVIIRMTNNSNNWWDTQVNTDNSISWDYKDSEKARITSGGDFLVGTTAAANKFVVRAAQETGIEINSSDTNNSRLITAYDATNSRWYINSTFSGTGTTLPLTFLTGNTERARITSGGYFKASNNGTYLGSTSAYHEMVQTDNNQALFVYGSSASLTNDVFIVRTARNTTNNTYYPINYYNEGASAYKFRVADSGDVTNTNGTYGTISDAKMKTDIVDAGSQWSDIKALRFRKFKMKDDPSGLVQLGVVAQEVELTSPGLVDEHADKDAEGNDLGTTTKSVKTSVLLMKAAVALQEAMARIEQLEAKVAALEGK